MGWAAAGTALVGTLVGAGSAMANSASQRSQQQQADQALQQSQMQMNAQAQSSANQQQSMMQSLQQQEFQQQQNFYQQSRQREIAMSQAVGPMIQNPGFSPGTGSLPALGTIATSSLGDQSSPNLGRNRLLGN